MIALSLWGSEGTNVARCVQEGQDMFGVNWKQEYEEEMTNEQKRVESQQRAQVEAAEFQRQQLMDAWLPPASSPENIVAPSSSSSSS